MKNTVGFNIYNVAKQPRYLWNILQFYHLKQAQVKEEKEWPIKNSAYRTELEGEGRKMCNRKWTFQRTGKGFL